MLPHLLYWGAGNSVATYQSILGSILIDMWHSQLGIALAGGNFVDTWTGQIQGTVLQAPAAGQRPVYGADGTVFGGKAVVQCAVTGSLCVRNNVAFPIGLIPTGTQLWVGFVQRMRTLSTTVNLIDIESASAIQMNTYSLSSLSNVHLFSAGADRASGAAITTGRQLLATSIDGVNAKISVDGTVTSAAYASTTTAPCTKIAFGGSTTGTGCADLSLAVGWICSAPPSAAQYTALAAAALAEFPP